MRATDRVSIEPSSGGFGRGPVAPEMRYSAVRSRWSQTTRSERAFVVCGATIVIVFVAAAIAPQLFTRQNPDALYTGPPLVGPSVSHWFGTDELGRDFYARVVYAARASLTMSVLIVAIGGTFGTVVGIVAGYVGGWVDEALMRLTDLFLALPGFVLALALAAVLGRGEKSVVIALSIVWWPSYARLVRGMILELKQRAHVEAARALGATGPRIILKDIAPFTWGQINARITQDLGYALVNVAGLGFLGLGVQPPATEWGSLLESGLQYIATAWWLTLFPGLAITVWTVGVAMLGDGIAAMTRSEQRGPR
ncbi:MAG TPA: ABC transporter permease [Acidimicrobiales bacterium]|nr:ABC transporter permease [Acidimicrobiales bacterium]